MSVAPPLTCASRRETLAQELARMAIPTFEQMLRPVLELACDAEITRRLDRVMAQATRDATDRPIDRRTIQASVGSLVGQGVTKGVFITTSTFAGSAEDYVKRGSNTKAVPIDGQALLGLMLRHEIGVRAERSFKLLAVDQNHFEDGD
jgi:restriction endonuclease Mrr